MIDNMTNAYDWLTEAVGGPGNSNLILMGGVALGLGWILLRAVRQGAAMGAASRMSQKEKQDPTLLLALKQAEARIHQLEAELEELSSQRIGSFMDHHSRAA